MAVKLKGAKVYKIPRFIVFLLVVGAVSSVRDYHGIIAVPITAFSTLVIGLPIYNLMSKWYERSWKMAMAAGAVTGGLLSMIILAFLISAIIRYQEKYSASLSVSIYMETRDIASTVPGLIVFTLSPIALGGLFGIILYIIWMDPNRE